MTSVWMSRIEPPGASDGLSYRDVCAETYLGAQLAYKIHPVKGQSIERTMPSGPGIWSEKIFLFEPD